MGRLHGKLGPGYMRTYRELKREEAQERQARDIPHSRRRRHRIALEKLGECPDCEEQGYEG